MKNLNTVPIEINNAIEQFIEILRQDNSAPLGFNQVPKESVFTLLENKSTVIYFPLENEENDGFHVSLPVNDIMENFVYINTSKYVEKQIFTAAHELGHLLKLEDYLRKKCKSYKEKNAEYYVNRFAAILLIPTSILITTFTNRVKILIKENEIQKKENNFYLTELDMFRIITYLMDFFFVPYKTIVRRLYECNCISEESVYHLLEIEENDYPKLIKKCIDEGKYEKLSKANAKKSFGNLPEMLSLIEKKHVFPKEKIDYLRKLFKFEPLTSSNKKDLSINIQEDIDVL
ncbi:MAG: ImmA/IrrE family metallo-endopeptidase [Treponema sp.]|nr:ImmA/IrrE family metallo-endopeptidase [Treponema sp.]